MYDLTVANAHTFYANGILVHNCGDAGQYLSLHYNAQILGLGPQKSAKREVVSSGYVYV